MPSPSAIGVGSLAATTVAGFGATLAIASAFPDPTTSKLTNLGDDYDDESNYERVTSSKGKLDRLELLGGKAIISTVVGGAVAVGGCIALGYPKSRLGGAIAAGVGAGLVVTGINDFMARSALKD